jgi:histone-lysine N-methyltransferase SETMAR
MEWRLKNSPGQKNPQMSESKIKTMLICFFDIGGIIHFEFVPEGTTVNQAFYMEVLKKLIDGVRHKQGELWRDCSLIFYHDNAMARFTSSVAVFSRKGISTADHAPYSPDLAPPDFWLFPELNTVLKGKRF